MTTESPVEVIEKTIGMIIKVSNTARLFNSLLDLFLLLMKRYKNNIRLSISREYPIGPNVLKICGTK